MILCWLHMSEDAFSGVVAQIYTPVLQIGIFPNQTSYRTFLGYSVLNTHKIYTQHIH